MFGLKWRRQLSRLCRRRRMVLLVLLFMSALVALVRFLFGDVTEKKEETPIAIDRLRQKEFVNKKGMHVIVAHYYGKNQPWEPTANLTKEILNRNSYSPVPGEGEGGEPVYLPSMLFQEAKLLQQVNHFNLMVSDRISVNRSLPDFRRAECKQIKPSLHELPTASVIVVFHNEAWSTLLRTVHSVLNRSPRHLLKEVILVDDASEREFLKRPLEDYVSRLPVLVRVLRCDKRRGLISARLKGSRAATGQVLVFLDAHCECTQGWLEPLLQRIAQNRTCVVCPIIDIIKDDTFAYVRSFDMHWGAFNWALHFRWFPVGTDVLEQRRQNPVLPFKTPAMAGGLFAIDSQYFSQLGEYDEKMDIWGGENIELSFRVWMCGGRVETVPCSRVGHVFRKSSPYEFPGGVGKILHQNLARVAEVWMDEWKEFYYLLNPEAAKVSASLDVRSRKELRQELNCHDFSWYLQHVWPQHFFPTNATFFGKVQNQKTGHCLQSASSTEGSFTVGKAVANVCAYEVVRSQVFVVSRHGYIMTDDSVCLGSTATATPGSVVVFAACNQQISQRWTYNEQGSTLVHMKTGLCVGLFFHAGVASVVLQKCSEVGNQKWQFEEISWR